MTSKHNKNKNKRINSSISNVVITDRPNYPSVHTTSAYVCNELREDIMTKNPDNYININTA